MLDLLSGLPPPPFLSSPPSRTSLSQPRFRVTTSGPFAPSLPPSGVVRKLTALARFVTPVFGCLFISSYLQLMQRGGDLQGC